MSTEIKLADLKPMWNVLKIAARVTFEVVRGAWWLGTKNTPKPKDKKQIDDSFNEIIKRYRQGVVFGKHYEKYVTLGNEVDQYIVKPETSDGHVMVVGGVGSGKSSCIAIPTLHSFKGSVFAIDIKGELGRETSFQRMFNSRVPTQGTKTFNPAAGGRFGIGFGYDPYHFLRTSQNRAQEARAIAQAIIPLPPDIKDPFWIESAQNIFTASILHYSGQGLSFLETIQQMQGLSPIELIAELCDGEATYFVSSMLNMDEKVLSSIVAEISKNVVHFVTDKNLINALSKKNNITPADLEYGYDIYIQIPEHLLRQWKNLLTLIVNQFLRHFEQRQENNAQPILFLLDEFPRLGKINAIIDGLATLRSKKITICLIIQSLAQLDLIYGMNERKVIADTCSYKAILSATDAETQEYFSRLVGTYDKEVTQRGTQSSPFIEFPKGKSTNTYEQEKRIIKPEEFATLRDIVLLTPFGNLRVKKQPYYLNDRKKDEKKKR